MICTCGHDKSIHCDEWNRINGRMTHCQKCQHCNRQSGEHVLVDHQFTKCTCNAFREETQ